ncbi:MAG: hypothetical protein EF812_00180, partial [Methanosarcinales archaeon]
MDKKEMKGRRNGFWKISVFAFLFAVLAFINIGCASTDMIYVPESGNQTIQQAVDNATAGDTIVVRDSTYNENVNVNVAHLTIRSQNGTANCIVNASDSGDHVFNVTADYVNISEFTVTGATTGWSNAGIYLNGTDHCNISDNFASSNNCGIYLNSSSSNNLTSNTASSNNCGIYLNSSSSNNLTSNTASSNNQIGIYLNSSSNNTFMSNIASDNSHGIYLWYSSNNTFMSNIASDNSHGIILSFSSNNNLTSNTINSNNNYGISMWSSSNNILYHNNLINNTN